MRHTLVLVLWICAWSSVAAEPHWAFQPIKDVHVPEATTTTRNPIDAFVEARLNGLRHAPESDSVTLVRRVYLVALGLPPTPEEVKAHTNNYEKLIDHVLAAPQFGERWARHWLDVVRFAETHGFEMNQPRPNAWRYRDYVIRTFNEDKPYDQFIREQLAGDIFGEDAATGFIVGGPWDQVKSPDAVLTANQRADELHDMVSTTSSAFLGLTVGCARCHDHKFDPIPQDDYYSIKACFAEVQHGERRLKTADYEARMAQADKLRARLSELDEELAEFEPKAPVNARFNVEKFTPVAARKVRFTIHNTTALEPCIDELEIWTADRRNVALASAGAVARASSVFPNSDIHRLEHINDGKYGNSWSWISAETTKGWVEIEFPRVETITKILWGRDREEKFKDRLATSYEITADGHVIASSTNREPYKPNAPAKAQPSERKKLQEQMAELTAMSMVYAGTFVKPEPTHRLHRGDPMLKRETIEPGVLSQIFPRNCRTENRRLRLADWIADPKNPLTARVIVNRLWHYYFGQGIVSTPSDFGINGARPTHPELLDWLANELISHDWKLKHIHRLILTSRTFRQSSGSNDRALALDAGNTLLWRFAPRRLEAEAIRDGILTVSGALDLRQGGPGWSPFEPNDNYVRVYNPKQEFGPAEWRRMIYATIVRQRPDGVFGAFDCPDGGQIAPKRTSSTTPLQALNLLNSRFIMQQAELFAKRVRNPRQAFELAFGRTPTPAELTAAEEFIREQGMTLFCRALFNANEFVYVF
jgi:hypothetical protein